jgi:hypothetical protein
MPLKGFYCPDKTQIATKECYAKCRMGKRCLTLPTLMAVGNSREWTGKPSTTQLLPGSCLRQVYLKITNDYYIDPESMAFALLGTRHHSHLEHFAKYLEYITEHRLYGEASGAVDLLEPDELIEKQFVLSDMKTWGSYQIKKFNDGDEMADATYQLNQYRILLEHDEKLKETLGYPVKISRMQVQATIRDGGTYIARQNGVEKRIIILPIKFVDDEVINAHFSNYKTLLLDALNTNQLPEVTNAGTWNWRRCKGYCETFDKCPEGRKLNKIF